MGKSIIDAQSETNLQKLLGVFDENITTIMRQLSVEIFVRGTQLEITGEDQAVSIAEKVLIKLLEIIFAGEVLDKSKICYCVELAKEGNSDDIAKIMSGVIAITARGKQIKCKTLGQKKYIETIKKNLLTFGIGPAGTGKTYLAVTQAAASFKNKEYERIILTRPAVEAGEKLGFLPGDLQTKVDPYLRPL